MEKLLSVASVIREIHPVSERPECKLVELRVEYLIYLCDWAFCQSEGRQLTEAHWVFDQRLMPRIERSMRDVIDHAPHTAPVLYGLEREVVSHLVESTQDMTLAELVEIVRVTYPLNRQTLAIDLIESSRELKETLRLAEADEAAC